MVPLLDALFLPGLTEPRLDAGFDLGRYLALVGGLLATLFVVAWGLRRVLATSVRQRAARRSLRVVDVLPLGGRRQLTVVRCYDRTFLLGLGEKDVSLVAEIDPVTVEDGKPEPAGVAPGDPETRRFEALFERARAKLDGRVGKAAARRPAPEEGVVA